MKSLWSINLSKKEAINNIGMPSLRCLWLAIAPDWCIKSTEDIMIFNFTCMQRNSAFVCVQFQDEPSGLSSMNMVVDERLWAHIDSCPSPMQCSGGGSEFQGLGFEVKVLLRVPVLHSKLTFSKGQFRNLSGCHISGGGKRAIKDSLLTKTGGQNKLGYN